MPDELPKGWVKTTLGEIVEPSRKRVLPADVPAMRYIGLEHIEPQTMRVLGHGYGRDVRSSSVLFSKGDVLYGKMRPYLNKVWVAEYEGICSAELLVFPKCDSLNSQFLALRLNAEDFVNFANGHVSGERPRVNFEKLSNFTIVLPPTHEQDRIVAKLSATLSRVASGEKATYRALQRLISYRSAVFDAAASGELTREWRGKQQKKRSTRKTGEALLQQLLEFRRVRWEEAESKRFRAAGKTIEDDKWKSRYPAPSPPKMCNRTGLPEGWIWVGWDQAGFSQNGRPFSSKEYSDVGVKLLRPGNLYADGSVRWTHKNTRYVPLDRERENPDLVIRGSELVINLTAQSLKDEFLGRVCLTSAIEHCLLNQRLARLTPVLGCAQFFLYLFKSSIFRRFVDGLNSGSLIQHMFTSQLSEFSFPFPPVAEQIEIAHEVEHRLSAADRLATRLEHQLIRARASRQSFLTEAFAGRLVPQDPYDEPAPVLLERIRATRETVPQKPKAERMPKTKSELTVARRPLLEVLRQTKEPMTPEQLFKASGYQQQFEDHECSQEIVDSFYEELRQLIGAQGPVLEKRPDQNTVLLEVNNETGLPLGRKV